MSVKHLTDNEFKSRIENEGVTLVEFGAPWCAPCKTLLPILDDLDQEYGGNVPIYQMNADESPVSVSEFGIMSLPTVMIFKDNEPVEKLVGLRSKEAYKTLIAKTLA